MNPVAGGGRARRFWDRCERACRQAGVALEVCWTTRRGEAADLAAAAGERLVVAVGGDGTAHEVVNGLLRRSHGARPRFGALLVGTGCDLARSLPSPKKPARVPDWLRQDRWRPIDVGRVGCSGGRRYFVNAADVGIGADVVRRAAQGSRALGGRLNFLGAAVASLLVHQNALLELCLDGAAVETVRVRTVAIANGAFLGGGMWMAPQARPDDGLFDVCIVGDLGRFEGIASLPMLYRGTHGRLAKVRFARARRVEVVAAQPVGVEADGELVGETPATFDLLPAALDAIDWKG